MTAQLSFFDESKQSWLALARSTAQAIVRRQGEVSADDIHRECAIPPWLDGRVMGRVFQGMRLIRYQKSVRRECHHRPVGVFIR